jgi:hypothetical protein
MTESRRTASNAPGLYARALVLWPGLDRRALARTRGDTRRIARLVARRTLLREAEIEQLLLRQAERVA